MEDKPKISNLEWGLVIAALFIVDAIQIFIEWIFVWFAGISIVINFLIDLWVAMSLALYLQMRGQSMGNPKRLFGLLGTFGLEMWPGISELPLWTLDGIYYYIIYKSDTILNLVNTAVKVVNVATKLAPVANKAVNMGGKVLKFAQKASKTSTRISNNDLGKAA